MLCILRHAKKNTKWKRFKVQKNYKFQFFTLSGLKLKRLLLDEKLFDWPPPSLRLAFPVGLPGVEPLGLLDLFIESLLLQRLPTGKP